LSPKRFIEVAIVIVLPIKEAAPPKWALVISPVASTECATAVPPPEEPVGLLLALVAVGPIVINIYI
jgi:hypothetical protein